MRVDRQDFTARHAPILAAAAAQETVLVTSNTVPPWQSAALLVLLALASPALQAADDAPSSPPTEQAPAPAAAPASAADAADPAAKPASAKKDKFEGALGLVLTYGAEYTGGQKRKFSLTPAGFLRYGRISVSGAGGFTTRRADDVERGLAAELVRRSRLRVNLALRYDTGRDEADSEDLRGMGDIEPTVRARLLARYSPDDLWTISLGSSVDLLGRGGGYWADLGVTRGWRLGPDTRLSIGASLAMAGDRYLQHWYGVSEAQSAASGYPVFKPREGLRDIAVAATLRTELTPRWGAFVGLSASRLIGSVADSPIVKDPAGWKATGGLAWRF